MDHVYMQYLQQIGIKPADYIQIQANYLRFLANSLNPTHTKSKSCSYSIHRPDPPNKRTPKAPADSFKKPLNQKMRYEDIPIKPGVPYEQLLSNEIHKNQENLEKTPEKTTKFDYLKKHSRNFSLSSSKKLRKNEDFREINGENKIVHRKSQSVSNLKKNENPQFLKKGHGKLCTKSNLLSKSLSPGPKRKERSPEKTMNLSKSSPKLSQKWQNRSTTVKKYQKSELNIESRVKEDQRYMKMLKEVEVKSKKFEKDAEDFYKVREKELNSLTDWKNSIKAQVFEEKLSLQNEILELRGSENQGQTLAAELKELKSKIDQQEEGFSEAVRELQEKVEVLKKENESLLDKFKALQPNKFLKPPSTVSRSRRSSDPPTSEAALSKSRNLSKDIRVPKLKLEKLGGKAQEIPKCSPSEAKNSFVKVAQDMPKCSPSDAKNSFVKIAQKPYLQRAYFSLKK